MLNTAKGVYIVAQTPFDELGQVDLHSIDTLVDFYRQHGANGFTVLGVSGEAGKLSAQETRQVAQRYIQQAGDLPVVIGVSHPSLAQLGDFAAQAMDMGAAGVMIAPPAGLQTDEDLLGYFDAVFRRLEGMPTVLQDFPFASKVAMSVPLIHQLIERHDEIQLIKEEDLPCLNKISRLREGNGRRVAIMTGNNALYLPLELHRGADGPMAGFSYPEMLAQVYALHQAGRFDQADDLFDVYLPLLRYEAMGFWGVCARKEVMRRRGAIRHATMRTPGPRLSSADLSEIDRLVTRLAHRLAR
ncbi:dihydrodipicolinate synthase family protein [Pseudomonas sp. dw_358]|uniref:dihydrodipicolinate synthase family protein n=1 Tax=Pseudomonas sp. dw_358 TaxID=2720083 RepID=UPI001BD2189B|nr:dihydrodipicolinate synthase family protein [Pseudomonas sp. dw_358]